MSRITIFIPSLKSGGAEKQAALLALALCHDHTVSLVTYYGEIIPSIDNSRLLSGGQIIVYALKGSRKEKHKDLKKILNSTDILFNYLTLCDFYGSIIAKHSGVKKIFNGIRNAKLPLWKLFLEIVSGNLFANGVIFNSFSGFEKIGKRYFRNSIVIQNCFYEAKNPILRDNRVKRIITIGRFVPQKDYKTAIQAIARVKQTFDNFEFHIVGYGELENQIRQWVKEYGVESITTIHINPSNIQELLRESCIYISTSIFEGTSNSIMEAMNWSIPVIATDAGDNKILVKNGTNGTIVRLKDYESIALSVIELLNNPEKRNSLGMEGNRIIRETYSMEAFRKEYERLI